MLQTVNSKNKIMSMIGMAYKANRVVSGEELLKKSIKEGKIKLIIIAEDASNNTKKRLINSALHYSIPYYICLSMDDLRRVISWKYRAFIGITDLNFSKILGKLIDDSFYNKE